MYAAGPRGLTLGGADAAAGGEAAKYAVIELSVIDRPVQHPPGPVSQLARLARFDECRTRGRKRGRWYMDRASHPVLATPQACMWEAVSHDGRASARVPLSAAPSPAPRLLSGSLLLPPTPVPLRTKALRLSLGFWCPGTLVRWYRDGLDAPYLMRPPSPRSSHGCDDETPPDGSHRALLARRAC